MQPSSTLSSDIFKPCKDDYPARDKLKYYLKHYS